MNESNYEKRLQEALDSQVDLFGLEVLGKGEPSYDAVKDYLRPLKMAEWEHRYHPLVLSDICSPRKARVLCTGSEIHLEIREPGKMFHQPRFTARIMVGEAGESFGSVETNLTGPGLREGWLPMYEWSYRQDGVTYRQLVYALEEPDAGLTVRWRVESDTPGKVEVRLEGVDGLHLEEKRLLDWSYNTRLLDGSDNLRAVFPQGTEYDAERQAFVFKTEPGKAAHLAFTEGPAPSWSQIKCEPDHVEMALRRCEYRWKELIRKGSFVKVPEEYVNRAWKALIAGNLTLMSNDALRYSAHNAYQRQYANETGTAATSLAMYGHDSMTRRALQFMFLYEPKLNTQYGAAGWRLRYIYLYHLLSGDNGFIMENVDAMRGFAHLIIESRKSTPEGLLPKSAYAGDHPEVLVYNAVTNAIAWRGLRDFSIMLKSIGLQTDADYYAREAAEYRKVILDAIEKSVIPDGQYMYFPLGLLDDDHRYEHITDTTLGSYYNIMIQQILWTGLFPPGSPRPQQIADWCENHGGTILGLLRVGRPAGKGGYTNQNGINEVYGLPKMLYLLNTGQIDKFLLVFYSKLAHGLTRDTFNGAEGTSALPVSGEYFRRMGRPPNSFSNAVFLQSLRYMLVMEKDADDDGLPDELHLASGTPRSWLEPEKEIKVESMPTAFGPVSYRIASEPGGNNVDVEINRLRRGDPKSLVIMLRLPSGKRISSVTLDGMPFSDYDAGSGQISLPPTTGQYRLQVALASGS